MELTEENVKAAKILIESCKSEAAKRIVGQEAVIDGILTAVIAGGHILLEGVPGLAKTLAVKTFADISALSFKRLQFTPDLLPADILGTLFFEQQSGTFSVRKGPIFSNVVLADEVNRSPAKVQSALLEAMAEKQVTIGEKTYALPEPFIVLATQNPIEQDGTYPLPAAELDRFLLKIVVPYPSADDEIKIVQTAGEAAFVFVNAVLNEKKIAALRLLSKKIVCDEKILAYIVSIVRSTRPREIEGGADFSHLRQGDVERYIFEGASPRAGIALLQCARVRAIFAGRTFVLPDDVKSCAHAVLRHRISLSYEATSDGITQDALISKILSLLPVP